MALSFKGLPVADNTIYKVLTNNFLADGGDGYLAFKKALSRKNTQEVLIQPMVKYLKSFDLYNPVLDGRVEKTL